MNIHPQAVDAWRNGDADGLARFLRLKPWSIHPMRARGRCPYPVGSIGHQQWQRALELRTALDRAVIEDNAGGVV